MTQNPILIEDALSIILEHAQDRKIESVSLLESLDCVLAEDMSCDINLPPFNSSAMDGFACRKEDLVQASKENPVALSIVGHIGAGQTFDGDVLPGQCIRIMTGCAVPDAFDSVEMIENVTWEKDGLVGDTAYFTQAIGKTNINPRGQEALAGSLVMRAGEVIDAAGIGLLASAGHGQVRVYARPRVGIISTGSELSPVDAIPAPGKIRDSNSYSLAAAAKAAGAEIQLFPSSKDDKDSLQKVILEACDLCDIVVSSGGVSVGDFDLIPNIVDTLGEMHFSRVNMKPGKSQVFARINEASFFGLAGNPTAASIGFERLVRPLIRSLRGFTELARPVVTAKLSCELSKRGNRKTFLRGVIEVGKDSQLSVTPAQNQSSSLIGTLHRSNCLIMMPEGKVTKNAGDTVDCLRLDIEEGTAL
ncbi:MAG: gephyrin-like molybdotransferase Glp [Raoultibacter sp.]|jgi:molybdopterin molybdotransferase